MIRRILITLISCAALATTIPAGAQSEVYNSSQHRFSVTTIADGLEIPWSMNWLPNGAIYVATENNGILRLTPSD